MNTLIEIAMTIIMLAVAIGIVCLVGFLVYLVYDYIRWNGWFYRISR